MNVASCSGVEGLAGSSDVFVHLLFVLLCSGRQAAYFFTTFMLVKNCIHLKERITMHRSAIKRKNLESPVARQFCECNHKMSFIFLSEN